MVQWGNGVKISSPQAGQLARLVMDPCTRHKLSPVSLEALALVGLFRVWAQPSTVNGSPKLPLSHVTPCRWKSSVHFQPACTPALFRPTFNAPVKIYSYGAALGLTYKMPRGFMLSASYNYDNFTYDESGAPEGFQPAFNLSDHKWQASLSNQGIVKNLGFDISYRWNAEVDYFSSYAVGTIAAYGVLNANINYKVPAMKSIFKAGGQNLLREKYHTNPGGPSIGWQFYFGWTFDMNIM